MLKNAHMLRNANIPTHTKCSGKYTHRCNENPINVYPLDKQCLYGNQFFIIHARLF